MSAYLDGSQFIWDRSAPLPSPENEGAADHPEPTSEGYTYVDRGAYDELVPNSEVDPVEPPRCPREGAFGHPARSCPDCIVRQRWAQAVADARWREIQGAAAPTRLLKPGGSLILDAPDQPVPVWGEGERVLMAQGEALLIVGPQGVGKSTLAQQLALARCGVERFADILDLPVTPGSGRVLYLAMDRPKQITRSMRRMIREEDRELLDDRLRFHEGPPPARLTEHPDVLLRLCQEAGADTVVVDSLKDAGSVVDDEGGTGWNTARQLVLAEGIEVLELHHQRKGGTLDKIDEVYGSTWVTSGAGSVLAIQGEPGDQRVRLKHLKQPNMPVGPLTVQHDRATGLSTLVETVDLVALAARPGGVEVLQAAYALTGNSKPTKPERERARRALQRLEEEGRIERAEQGSRGVAALWRAVR